MDRDLLPSLQTHFGFPDFRHGQLEAVQSLMSGQHTLVVMPTGSGKSLIYQLTALHLSGVTLVISPLIALMKDQVDSLERRGVAATFVNSALAPGEINQRLARMVSGEYRIVYIAPERLRSIAFQRTLERQTVSLLVVDEAHCISEWGHDFRPDYLHIAQFRTELGNPLTAALTATATPQVQNDIIHLLGLSPIQRLVTGFNRPNLYLEVRYTPGQASRLRELRELLKDQQDGAAIVYTGTRREAEEVAEFISSVVRVKAQYYHAGLQSEERTRIQNAFMAGDLSVVVATNAFGMGIDRPDVRQVIHYSMPGSLEAYYQEAGRAGRDGLPARAVMLYSPEDRALQEWFIETSEITVEDLRLLFNAVRPAKDRSEVSITNGELSILTGLQEVKVRLGLSVLERAGAVEHRGDEGTSMRIRPLIWNETEIQANLSRFREHQKHRKVLLAQMILYAETNSCRRKIILEYFGDLGPATTDVCCDNCLARQPDLKTVNRTGPFTERERLPLVILDVVRRLPRNVGKKKITMILKGSKKKEIIQFGYDKNVYFGRLAVYSLDELERLINQLIETGLLKVIGGRYPVIQLTVHGEAAIRNKAVIPLELSRQTARKIPDHKKDESVIRGTSAVINVDSGGISNEISLTIMDCVRSIPGKLPRSGVAKLLVGSGSERVQNFHSHPFYSCLKGRNRSEVMRAIDRLLASGQLAQDEHGHLILGQLAKTQLPSDDSIQSFLSRPHPRQLPGPWDEGWALSFHSQFSGANWGRSGTGELAYRLKYQADLSVIPALVEQAQGLVKALPDLCRVDMVIPVPPSTPRPHDPVSSFAKSLAKQLELPCSPILIKTRQTRPQKELHTAAQKRANVAGAFSLNSSIKNKSVMVIDDLFDSGATLEEIYRLLHHSGASRVYVLTLTRSIHSDA